MKLLSLFLIIASCLLSQQPKQMAAFRDALLDLKASVEVGVTHQDYQHKLQYAAAAELKAKGVAYAAQTFAQCHMALDEYKLAARLWNFWWWDGHSELGDIEHDRPVSMSELERADESEVQDVFKVHMLKLWKLASRCLDDFKACRKE